MADSITNTQATNAVVSDGVATGLNAIPLVGGVLSAISKFFNFSAMFGGETASKGTVDLASMTAPLLLQWTNVQLLKYPADSAGINEWYNNFQKSIGSDNAFHNYMTVHRNMMVQQKYLDSPMPREWDMAWNWIATYSGNPSAVIPIPLSVTYSSAFQSSIAGAILKNDTTGGTINGPVTNPNLFAGITGNISSTNIFLIIGLVGALLYLFLKGKK